MITYLKGDATRPQVNAPTLIVHVSNDRGGWGRGFVLAISKRWPEPEAQYRKWHSLGHNEKGELFELGNIQVVPVEPNLSVVNMLAQSGYGKGNLAKHRTDEPDSTPPIRYDALESCLGKVRELAMRLAAEVHMPRIGTGLGGSSWGLIEPIVDRTLSGLPVMVYDYAP